MSFSGSSRYACESRASRALRIAVAAMGLVAGRAPAANAQVPGELTGRVIDARTTQPIAGARVVVPGSSERARTDAAGEFVIRGLASREYDVQVRALGHTMFDSSFAISNGRRTRIEVTLEPAAMPLDAMLVRARRDEVGAAVLDREAIERSGRRDLGELLRTLPGVVVAQAGGPGSPSRISIRGSGANEVLVLIDGVPLNSSISGEADFSRVDLETVNRVTVVPGAQSARYGARALAGVVLIETRRPLGDVSMRLRAGSWGERGASATLGDVRDAGSLRSSSSVTTVYRSTDGDFPYEVPVLRGGGRTRRVNGGTLSHDLLASTGLEGERWSATARASVGDSRRGLPGSIVQPSTTGHGRDSRATSGADLVRRGSSGTWTLSGGVARERSAVIDTAPPYGSRFADSVRATSGRVATTVTVDGHGLSTLLGAEARSLDIRATDLASSAPRWQRWLGAWGSAHLARPIGDSATEASLDAGVRVDQNSLIRGVVASPRVAAGLRRGSIAATVSLAQGYAPPTLADQFFHEGVLVRANPSLHPERTRNDAEVRVALRDKTLGPLVVGAEAAAFRADVDGMILWLPNFQFVWSPANYRVHRSGWEQSLRLNVPSLAVDVEETLNRSDVVYAGGAMGGQVAYRPRTTGAITASAVPRHVRFTLTERYVGARRTVPGSPLNMLDSYWIADAQLSAIRAARGVTVEATLGAENLFDRPAAMLVDYPFPGRTWTLSLRLRRSGAGTAP